MCIRDSPKICGAVLWINGPGGMVAHVDLAAKMIAESSKPIACLLYTSSGERDALCVKSLGFSPVWFNSESYKLSEQDYKEIMKYVEVLYNICLLYTSVLAYAER